MGRTKPTDSDAELDRRTTVRDLLRSTATTLHSRQRVFVAAGVLAALAVLGSWVWQSVGQRLRTSPRYAITAADIRTSTPPPWVRSDIATETLRDTGLAGNLSLLDPPERLQLRLAEAFQFHPWVRSVGTITKQAPKQLFVELSYRKPLASVEVRAETGETALLPVDADGVRLPERDLSSVELRYLPRILGVDSRPSLRGEPWLDTRVQGAVAIVAGLGSAWTELSLVDIAASRMPEIRGDQRYYTYELLTSGQTRIVWGAAPGAEPRDESPLQVKLGRLQNYVRQHGPLDSLRTTAVIDVRRGIKIQQRVVERDEPADQETRK